MSSYERAAGYAQRQRQFIAECAVNGSYDGPNGAAIRQADDQALKEWERKATRPSICPVAAAVAATIKTNSVAAMTVARCHDETLYYSVTDKGDCYHVRIYGLDKAGNGLVGFWQLITDDELKAIGAKFGLPELTAYRFQPGGIVVSKSAKPTCFAIVQACWMFFGKGWTNARFI